MSTNDCLVSSRRAAQDPMFSVIHPFIGTIVFKVTDPYSDAVLSSKWQSLDWLTGLSDESLLSAAQYLALSCRHDDTWLITIRTRLRRRSNHFGVPLDLTDWLTDWRSSFASVYKWIFFVNVGLSIITQCCTDWNYAHLQIHNGARTWMRYCARMAACFSGRHEIWSDVAWNSRGVQEQVASSLSNSK